MYRCKMAVSRFAVRVSDASLWIAASMLAERVMHLPKTAASRLVDYVREASRLIDYMRDASLWNRSE